MKTSPGRGRADFGVGRCPGAAASGRALRR
nr:MAG TPA: hypothetical protein [Caudoviricetes sp.]